MDPESLTSFVAAYQTVTPLTLGELWALPIMLRLALIENLRRVSARIADDRIGRNRADAWADQLIETAEKDPKNLIVVIADMARSNPPMESAFVAELTRRLQGQGPSLALPLTWIEQRLSESGWTIQQMVQAENQKQAANQVSMSNSIGSLRYLSALDWRKFVESMSVVEQILREDAGGVYGRMEFATRDRYRHVVEKIAKYSGRTECDVARKAIDLTQGSCGRQGRARPRGARRLLPDRRGRGATGACRGGAPSRRGAAGESLPQVARAAVRGRNRPDHAGSWPDCWWPRPTAARVDVWVLGLIGVLSMVAASQLAVALVNWVVTLLVTPHVLPRMDFSAGIPPECRTLVVVPTMLASPDNVEELIEALEVRFLANRDENLHFALLTDFRDAAEEVQPEDESLLRLAEQGIEGLNARYESDGGDMLLPVSPPAPLESAGTRLDGLRAQARQTRRLECAAARRRAGCLLADCRRYREADRREVRDHAGYRYAVAARCGAATGGRHGASVESRALLRSRGARLRGIRHSAAESRREPARQPASRATRACSEASPASTLTRAPSPTCTRICSARVRSSARASTMWMRSSARSRGVFRTTAFSVTIWWRAATRAPAC